MDRKAIGTDHLKVTLSNNAIKFLQAQYRAIFKRAYVKGLATAVLLTAGLAAGQAQAVNNPLVDNESGAFTSLDVVYDQDGDYTYSGGEAWANSVTISNGANVTISGTGSVHVNESVLVTGSGTSLTLNSAFNGSISDEGGDESKPLNDPTGAMTISDGATLTVSGTSSYFDDFTVDNATINIGGLVGSDASGSIADSTQLWVGQSDGDSVIDGENTKINLNSHSVLTFGRDAYLRDGVVTFEGADDFDAILQGNKSKTTYLQGTDFSVADGNHGAIFANHINMSAGTITNSGDMIISGRNNGSFSEGATMESATFQAADIVMTGGSIVNAGTLTIGAAKETAWKGGVESTTFTATGGSIKNTGSIDFYASDIELSESNFSGLLAVDGNKSGSVAFKFDETTNLTVDGAVDLNTGILDATTGNFTDRFDVSGSALNFTADSITVDKLINENKLTITTGTLVIDEVAKITNMSSAPAGLHIKQGHVTVTSAIEAKNSGSSLVVGLYGANSGSTTSLTLDGTGSLTNIDRLMVHANGTNSGAITVNGSWDFNGARLTLGSNSTIDINGTASDVGSLQISESSNAAGILNVAGNLEVGRLFDQTNASGSVNITGTLSVSGDGDVSGSAPDLRLTAATVNIENGGTFAITGDAVDDVVSSSGTVNTANWTNTKVTLNAGGTLSLDLGDITLTQDQLKSLKSGLVSTSSSGGSFDFGDSFSVTLDETLQNQITSGSVAYDDLVSAGVNDVQGVTKDATVVVDSGTAASGITLSNGAVAVELEGTNTVNVNSLVLTNTTGDNFVYTTDASERFEVQL